MSRKNATPLASMIVALLAGATACSGAKAVVDGGVSAGYTKIDDMEDGGNRTEWAPSGLIPGFWWTATGCTEYNNISPVPPTPPDPFAPLPTPYETFPGVVSKNAAHVRTTASLTGIWGAEMGFEIAEVPGSDAAVSLTTTPDGGTLNDTQGCPVIQDWKAATVDLTAYSGITFWAMAEPSGVQTIRVQLSDRNNDPRGGICNATDPTSLANCYNEFRTPLTLTNTFTRYTIDFASLQQDQTWGYRPTPDVLDLQHVYNISFAVDLPDCAASSTNTCAGGPPSVSFDFWIDDIYLVNSQAGG
jgi:hypothetical protein